MYFIVAIIITLVLLIAYAIRKTFENRKISNNSFPDKRLEHSNFYHKNPSEFEDKKIKEGESNSQKI